MLPFYETRQEELSVRPATHPISYSLHLHAHAELWYLFEGTIHMQIDGMPYTLDAGDLALCFPNVMHSFSGGQGSVRGVLIYFLPEACADYSRILYQMTASLPVLHKEEMNERVHDCLCALEHERTGAADNAVYRAYLQLLLSQILPLLQLQSNNFPETGDTLARTLQYVSAHFTEHITLDTVARTVGVSPYHISHLFSERMKVHFHSYINTLRIQHAKSLLQRSDAPITEIMYGCGFSSQRTFYRAFQEETGMTPAKFRQTVHRGIPPGSFIVVKER